MQSGSHLMLDAQAEKNGCTFCQRSEIATYILKETEHFLVMADHAPLVEGHILIVPRQHYACYGAVPATLDTALKSLKQEIQRFFALYYSPSVFWEHGVFRQTVFHAHLHCFPFGQTSYNLAEAIHGQIVHQQEDIRSWYQSQGHYFYMEDREAALLFPPETSRYFHIIQNVLWHNTTAQRGTKNWRTVQQRIEEGKPLIAAMIAKWQTFQQQERQHHAETNQG